MKSEIFLVGLLLAGVEAQVQRRSGRVQTKEQKLQSCTDKCLSKAVQVTKCSAKNHNCVCSNSQFMSSLGQCVDKGCGQDGFQVAFDKAGHFCADARKPSFIAYVTATSKASSKDRGKRDPEEDASGPLTEIVENVERAEEDLELVRRAGQKDYEFDHWLPWWDWWKHWVAQDPDKCKNGKECDYLSKKKGFAAWQAFWGKQNKGWENWTSSCNPKKRSPHPSPGKKPSPSPQPYPSPGKNPSPKPSPGKNPSPNPYPSPGKNPSPKPSPGKNPSPNPYPSPGKNPSPNPYPPGHHNPSPNPYPPGHHHPPGYPNPHPTHYTPGGPTPTVLPYW